MLAAAATASGPSEGLEEERGGRDEEDRGHLRGQPASLHVRGHPRNAIAWFSGDGYQFGANVAFPSATLS